MVLKAVISLMMFPLSTDDLTHLKLGSNTSTVVRITLGKHLHTTLADEISSSTHVTSNVTSETITFFLTEDLVVEDAHLYMCVCLSE